MLIVAGRGNGDGEVAKRFVAGAVGLNPVARRGPLLPPFGDGETGVVEIMAGLGKPLAALDHPYTIAVPLSAHPN